MRTVSIDDISWAEKVLSFYFFIGRAINGGGVALCLFPQQVTKNQRDQKQQVLKITPPVPIS